MESCSHDNTLSNILHDAEAYADAIDMQLALRPTYLTRTACVFSPAQLEAASL